MNGNLIICTVGTSLLIKKEARNNQIFPEVKPAGYEILGLKDQGDCETKLADKETNFGKLFAKLEGLIPKEQLQKRGENHSPDNPDFLPAELSSLYLFYWPDGNIPDRGNESANKDSIVLLYSEPIATDKDSFFCACCLKKYLEEKEPLKGKIARVEIKPVAGLQMVDARQFENRALPSLSKILKEQIEEGHKNNDNVVLNITGGYKVIPPYVVIIGNCFPDVDIIYLYEESASLIHLPPIPIDFDLPTYRDYRAIIKALQQPKVAKSESLYKVLPTNIKACFFKKNAERKLNFFGSIMWDKYKGEKIDLTPFGRGYLLLDKLQDSKLKDYLTGCINQWQHIWIGDKIPEMVEHQRGHTQRVLELAAELLYPILDDGKRKIFQSDEELASFISAIWLHDLGNSGERFKYNGREYVIKGFPSLIRDFHNLVTDTIIKDDETRPLDKKALFPQKVEVKKGKPTARNGISTIEKIIKNTRTISKYHRLWTPLTPDKVNKEGKHCIKLGEAIRDDKLRFLTALYRVLDACDTQLERTVDDAYINTRKMVVDWEVRILIEEKKKLEDDSKVSAFIESLKKSKCGKCSPEVWDSLKGGLDWVFKTDKGTEDMIDTYAECINHIVGNIKTCPDSRVSDTVERWLSCLDQVFFKKRQPIHYEKHKGIDAVMVLYEGKDNDRYKFNILMVEAEPEGGSSGSEQERKQNLENVLCKDIIKEYKEVKEILDKHMKLQFSYQLHNGSPQVFKGYNDSLECQTT